MDAGKTREFLGVGGIAGKVIQYELSGGAKQVGRFYLVSIVYLIMLHVTVRKYLSLVGSLAIPKETGFMNAVSMCVSESSAVTVIRLLHQNSCLHLRTKMFYVNHFDK